ncbi:hypothetical protein ABEF91_000923 [Exophiala dermatitidis]
MVITTKVAVTAAARSTSHVAISQVNHMDKIDATRTNIPVTKVMVLVATTQNHPAMAEQKASVNPSAAKNMADAMMMDMGRLVHTAVSRSPLMGRLVSVEADQNLDTALVVLVEVVMNLALCRVCLGALVNEMTARDMALADLVDQDLAKNHASSRAASAAAEKNQDTALVDLAVTEKNLDLVVAASADLGRKHVSSPVGMVVVVRSLASFPADSVGLKMNLTLVVVVDETTEKNRTMAGMGAVLEAVAVVMVAETKTRMTDFLKADGGNDEDDDKRNN